MNGLQATPQAACVLLAIAPYVALQPFGMTQSMLVQCQQTYVNVHSLPCMLEMVI